ELIVESADGLHLELPIVVGSRYHCRSKRKRPLARCGPQRKGEGELAIGDDDIDGVQLRRDGQVAPDGYHERGSFSLRLAPGHSQQQQQESYFHCSAPHGDIPWQSGFARPAFNSTTAVTPPATTAATTGQIHHRDAAVSSA